MIVGERSVKEAEYAIGIYIYTPSASFVWEIYSSEVSQSVVVVASLPRETLSLNLSIHHSVSQLCWSDISEDFDRLLL